jgi:hypothetical protein
VASLDPRTRRAAFNDIKKIEPLDPLIVGAVAFWAPPSLEELAHLQGAQPLEGLSVLAGGFPEDEDIDEFLNDIYQHRGAA